tara:strand:+ start:102 stop:851 length:750 start_codon:yes stop_codon:yes gene_type:complete
MINKFIGLSGLPRTGSTLLSAILDQNPDIHAEGNSAVCQLMWNTQQSCDSNCNEQLLANNRLNTKHDIVSAIPNIYYKDITSSVVIDKCRSWTLPDNMNMFANYIDPKPKVIVLERPIIDIVKSFVSLRKANNYKGNLEEGLLDDYSEPIIRSLNGIKWAKSINKGEFLFIQYDDLVDKTNEILKEVYKFLELPVFEHNLAKILNNHQENDLIDGLYLGQHDVRQNIGRRKLDVKLSDATLKRCIELDK